ncbi:hypothetical protein IQ235_10990 [Oscillatoriales cyanobacterium LEGE 11467]|uniref:Uncharacterized protein n=1 Tax=Zarconia navalis LEGE 11467 TaxID=1828826 RepID=A0A928Z877_9CYAN|nr:hypothetical protein [Zarconia navalis]MBE9041305.1 hypothetical protein [Zarconia navalis LEGE 11467]
MSLPVVFPPPASPTSEAHGHLCSNRYGDCYILRYGLRSITERKTVFRAIGRMALGIRRNALSVRLTPTLELGTDRQQTQA